MMTEANALVCTTIFYVVLYRPIKKTPVSVGNAGEVLHAKNPGVLDQHIGKDS